VASFTGSNIVTLSIPVLTDFTITFWIQTMDTGTIGGSGHWYEGKSLIDGDVAYNHNDFGISLSNNGQILFGIGNYNNNNDNDNDDYYYYCYY